ncbi:hypothetical protein BZA05DRAFT_391305 [Tricharina praecox]|uniref:uncharacterized protein n=1 Tax=Tricharina praecox TaxID=43433 RepID=UPI00221FBBBA|nr:uncharacterized protein BZA05DRAFT_391305 [Tricharina praecox]KAI5855340.1 hypothetical protein BZA05DRAFT_391305 [Tricharina praecox]
MSIHNCQWKWPFASLLSPHLASLASPSPHTHTQPDVPVTYLTNHSTRTPQTQARLHFPSSPLRQVPAKAKETTVTVSSLGTLGIAVPNPYRLGSGWVSLRMPTQMLRNAPVLSQAGGYKTVGPDGCCR